MPLTQRAKNVATSYVQISVALVAAVVTSRAVVSSLGADGYGVWALLQALTAFAALMVGGLPQALLRYMARFLGKGEPEAALEVARTGLSFVRRAVVLAIIVGILVYALLLPRLQIPEPMLGSARASWLLLLAAAALEIRALSPRVTLLALQRHDLRNWAQSGIVVLQTVLVVAAMQLGLGLEALGALRAMAFVLLLLSWEALARSVFPVPYRLGKGERFDREELLRFSRATTFIFLSETMVYAMDALVIGVVAGAAVVAFYTPAARLAETVRAVVYAVVNVVTPRAAELDGRGDRAAFEELLSRGSRICGFLAGPFIAAGIVCGDHLLAAWLGSEFSAAHPVLVALLLHVFFLASTSVLEGGLIASGAADSLARAHVLAAILNLVLSVWWVHAFGLVGPAAATAVTGAIMGGVVIPILYRRVIGRSIAFVYKSLAGSFLGLWPTAALLVGLRAPGATGRRTRRRRDVRGSLRAPRILDQCRDSSQPRRSAIRGLASPAGTVRVENISAARRPMASQE